jgi:hypothetical protein
MIFKMPKGGLSSLSSSQFRDMALGFDQQPSPPLYATAASIPSREDSDVLPPNPKQSQDRVDPFQELDQPIPLQPPPASNWENWETEAVPPPTVQWDSCWQEFPQNDILVFPTVASAHSPITPMPASSHHSDGNFAKTNGTNTLCDDNTLPQYMKKTPAAFSSSSQCDECSHLINQITSVIQNYETAQKELSSHKQQLEIYHGDTSLLLSPEDCDHFENEIYSLLFKIKAKKVLPLLPCSGLMMPPHLE